MGGGEGDEDTHSCSSQRGSVPSTCCLGELLTVKQKYAVLKETLERLQEQVLQSQQQSQSSQQPEQPAPAREDAAAAKRYRQWYEDIKRELGETARLMQDRDAETEAQQASLRASINELREELATAHLQLKNGERAREATELARKESDSRREVAEAAASALAEEAEMWRKRASAADVLEIEELRRRVMGAEAEVAKVKVEVGVARERYTEAVQRSQEAGARVAGLCQELGTWQERARLGEEEVQRLKAKLDKQKAMAEEGLAHQRLEVTRLQEQLRAQQASSEDRVRRVEEEASCRVRVLEEERVRLADRLAVMTAASVERSLSPMRRSGRAEQDAQTMQQENNRLKELLAEERGAWEQRVSQLDHMLRSTQGENDEMHREIGQLSDTLAAANRQLAGYERRLQQVEASTSREREREVEANAARRQLLRDRMMIENVLAKELGRVASSASPSPLSHSSPFLHPPPSFPPSAGREANLEPATQAAPFSAAHAAAIDTDNASTPVCFRNAPSTASPTDDTQGYSLPHPRAPPTPPQPPAPQQGHPSLNQLLVDLEGNQRRSRSLS